MGAGYGPESQGNLASRFLGLNPRRQGIIRQHLKLRGILCSQQSQHLKDHILLAEFMTTQCEYVKQGGILHEQYNVGRKEPCHCENQSVGLRLDEGGSTDVSSSEKHSE